MDTCLHEKRKAKAVEAVPPDWPATWLDRPTATWRVTASAKLVELSHSPINTPSGENQNTHTPLHGNSTCKALILSVVARRSLVGRVARL
jgi:hypothetical protein